MTADLPPEGDGSQHQANDFVDGRTDLEKLAELLKLTEGTHLDFKAALDLDSTEAKLRFVKDVVAMSNCPPGGYLLIGVTDDGDPCIPSGNIDRPRFEAARLADLVRGYVEGRVDLRVAIHEVATNETDRFEVVLIFVLPHSDGLPVPMSKVGNYSPDPSKPAKQQTVFRQGEIPVREGPANVFLRRSHWPLILAEYTRRVRAEASELAQSILRELIAEREQSRTESPTGRADIPLLLGMDEAAFVAALRTAFESDDDVKLRRFVRTATKRITSSAGMDDFLTALDKWTVLCSQALDRERDDLVQFAIEYLRDAYAELGVLDDDTRKRLHVVIRIYAIGSQAVRLKLWKIVHALALQPVPSNPFGSQFRYSSWIRHGQVDASRARLIPENRGGFLISATRELLVEHPAMRADMENDEIPPPSDQLAADDILANSACQFDIAYCLVVAAEGQDQGSYYPSSAALKDHRSAPIAKEIAEKPDVRRRLFPDSDDRAIAAALVAVYKDAERESMRYSMWWDMPHAARVFVEKYGAES